MTQTMTRTRTTATAGREGRDVIRNTRVRLAAGLALALCACASPAPADPERVRVEEERLLAPFLVERTIVADRLDLVMTANFYNEHFTKPGIVTAIQEETRRQLPDGGTEYVYVNKAPGGDPPLRLTFGKIEFGVLGRASVTVLGGRRALTLRADATGKVTVSEAGRMQNASAVKIHDGSYGTGG